MYFREFQGLGAVDSEPLAITRVLCGCAKLFAESQIRQHLHNCIICILMGSQFKVLLVLVMLAFMLQCQLVKAMDLRFQMQLVNEQLGNSHRIIKMADLDPKLLQPKR